MSVTIHDVAKHAGVSIATVSRVLNDSASVLEEKRVRVLAAAEALGYSPNPAALSLLNKQTGGIGVLLPFVQGEFFSELIGGLDEAAQEHGRFLVISSSHRQTGEFRKAIQVLDKRVDGLVVMAPELDVRGAASLLATETPVVFINTYTEGLAADVFNFDNYQGGYLLTRHLLDAGHRKIALLHGPPHAQDAIERARGYREAMAEAGVSNTRDLEFDGGYTREAGHAAAVAVLARKPRPTAIVAANDHCATGVVSALLREGVRVPDQMSVTGFDGLESSRYVVPPLTTVSVPVREIGRQAALRLFARLRGEPLELEQRFVPVQLVVRESTSLRETT
ncbi:MAG: LacI family DNA-binding transcriptional regulator [Bacteroidota bacterium]